MTMPSDLGRRARRRLPALVLALALMPAVARAQYVVREPMLQQFITDHDALVKSDAAALQRWSEAGYRTVDLQLVQSSVDIYLAGLRSMALGRQAEQLDCAAGVDQVYWEHLIAAETYTLLNRYCPRLVTLTGQAQGGEVPPVPPPSGGRPVATVAKAVGEVLVRTAGGDWRPLTGGSLGVNDEIATGVDASLTITFTDGTTLEYRELTRGLLSDVQTVEDRIKIRVLLKMGEIGAQVPKQETIRSDFSIKSPTLAASVRGTRFTVRYDTLTKVSTVAVQEGVVVVLPDAPGSHEIEVFRADVLAVGPAGARWVRQAAPATSLPPGAMPRPQPAAGAAAPVSAPPVSAPPIPAPPAQSGAGAVLPAAVVPADMMFQASKPRYAATNDAVNIQFAGFPGNAEDCITIAPPDAPPEQWVRQWCTDGLRAGTVAWADLTPGIYEARAHFDWTRQRGAIRARVYFQVGDVGGVGLPPQPTAPVSVPVPTQPPPTPPATVPTAPPTQPTPPAPAPPPAGGAAGANPITGFGYVDGTEDRVAEYDRGSPNGTPDAHFRLVLDAGTVAVKSIGVFSTDEAGTQRGDTRWCTDRAGGGWMAGVFRGGVQLNPSYVVSLGTFSGRTVLDVYGERASLVTPGSFYVVVVTLSDGRELTRTTRAGEPPPDAVGALPAAPTGAPAIAAFGFVDRSEDRIAEWDRGRPNGTPDAHFRLVLDGNGNTFRSIDVVASDAQGVSRLNTHWSTDQTHGNWMLGVFRDGQQLAPSYIPVLGRIDGRVTFELYGESAREAPDGAWFVVVVQLLDGREMTRVARVGDPFSSPGAIAAPIMPPPTVPAAPPPPTATAGATGIVDITLVGRTEDRVSHGDAQPNGARDSHYRLTVDLNGEEVRWIRVFESNPDGSTIGSGFWRTDSTGNSNWWLGVAANGQLLATTFKDSLGRMQGRTVLDLYADGADSYARPGQWLVFAITLGDGRELRKQLRAPQ